jgi:hypothetical protein
MTFSLDFGPLLPYWSVFLKSALLTLKMTTNTAIGDSDAAAAIGQYPQRTPYELFLIKSGLAA